MNPANSTKAQGRSVWSWALYDWANSAFATTVMAGFFPLFFKQYWSGEAAVTTSTFYLGFGNSIASLIIVLAAPILGALADFGDLRKRMLAAFMCAGVLATTGLFFVAQGMWPLAVLLYVIGIIGFSGANVFYDALLMAVSTEDNRHRVSALGYALGYLGGGLLFLINVVMTLKPEWFGLSDAAAAVRWSFLSVAVWWAVFSLPILLRVHEPAVSAATTAALDGAVEGGRDSNATMTPAQRPGIRAAFANVLATMRQLQQYRNAWLFLLAYWLYIDGVATIIRMAVDYGLSIGLPANSLITALLLVQFIGFPATLLFGRLAERVGARRGLWIGLWVYVIATTYAAFMDSSFEFYLLAVALGLVQGGVQSLSRSLFGNLIPRERSGEFFGFMNMMGKAAAVVGPILVGITASMTGEPRLGILSVLLLFFSGMIMLAFVDENHKQA